MKILINYQSQIKIHKKRLCPRTSAIRLMIWMTGQSNLPVLRRNKISMTMLQLIMIQFRFQQQNSTHRFKSQLKNPKLSRRWRNCHQHMVNNAILRVNRSSLMIENIWKRITSCSRYTSLSAILWTSIPRLLAQPSTAPSSLWWQNPQDLNSSTQTCQWTPTGLFE